MSMAGGSLIWTVEEAEELTAAAARWCDCVYVEDHRVTTCAMHRWLQCVPSAADGLLGARRRAPDLVAAEMDPTAYVPPQTGGQAKPWPIPPVSPQQDWQGHYEEGA